MGLKSCPTGSLESSRSTSPERRESYPGRVRGFFLCGVEWPSGRAGVMSCGRSSVSLAGTSRWNLLAGTEEEVRCNPRDLGAFLSVESTEYYRGC